MENFKKKLRFRVILMSGIAIGIAAINFILLFNRKQISPVPSFIQGFQVGIFTSVELFLIYHSVKYATALNKENALKKLLIEETDERTIMISHKIGSMGLQICLIGLGIATIIVGFFNNIAFFTLLSALAFVALVKLLLRIHYTHKF